MNMVRMPSRGLWAALLALGAGLTGMAHADSAADNAIIVASTTSTQDSGLFEYLLPIFERRSGITVHVVAQGTGQALDTARRGDADVVFVHARDAELKFLAEGESLRRYPVMYNDFVLVGPASDPARVRGIKDAAAALRAIRNRGAVFVSRGDRSGTNLEELSLWKTAGVDIDAVRRPWYRSIGQGMGATLNFAAATGGYTLSDRATWLNFGNKGELRILVEGDRRLRNQYGVMLVNPQKHPNVHKARGQAFIDYLVSPEGQRDIASYRINGQQLFYPDAGSDE